MYGYLARRAAKNLVSIASAREMFGNEFQATESLKALTYFEGGDLNSLSLHEKNILIKAVGEVGDLPEASIVSNVLSMDG